MKAKPSHNKKASIGDADADAKQAINAAYTGKFSDGEKGDALLNFARVYGGAELTLMESYRRELEEIRRTIEEIDVLQQRVDNQFELARVRGQLKE